MRIAFADTVSWRRQFPALEHLTVTVNLSARQLQEDTLVDDVSQALSDAALSADRVVLEITESMLLPSEGVTVERLDALADLGVRLFIDDFGTGYSSLSYLQQLPVHGIKLAREFVDSLERSDNARDGSKLVSTIKGIAETFGLTSIIAEGVETPEQRVALLELGYTVGQGYLMARPMSASSITKLLSHGPAVIPMDTESLTATRG
jgi:EAL domain-containing protein (putative c-di-GMP-specific phosphodiesterase class I)